MDQVRLERRERFAQHQVVMELERAQFAIVGDPRVLIDAVQPQTALDLRPPLLGAQAVVGGQHANDLPAQLQPFGDVLAPEVISAGVVRRIQIDQDQNFHPPVVVGPRRRFKRASGCLGRSLTVAALLKAAPSATEPRPSGSVTMSEPCKSSATIKTPIFDLPPWRRGPSMHR